MLSDNIKHRNEFGSREVTIGWYGNERVDYMTADINYKIRCYEIKVSKQDFRSHSKISFVGTWNYFVMPSELYEELKKELHSYQYVDIGVYVAPIKEIQNYIPTSIKYNGLHTFDRSVLTCVKKAKRRRIDLNREMLLINMLRSLTRDYKKLEHRLVLESKPGTGRIR